MILPQYDTNSRYRKSPVEDIYDDLTGQQTYALRDDHQNTKGVYSRLYMNNTRPSYSSKPDYFRSPVIPEIDIKRIYKRPGNP